MKAIIIQNTGDPDVLEYQDVPKPEIHQPDDMLVNIRAAGINPIDTKLRKNGTFYPDYMPAILGCDGAGIIEDVGSKVKKFKPEDEIYFCYGGLGKEQGNYAEYRVIPESMAALKPQNLSFFEAAAAPLALITAWESLYNRGRMKTGQTILIHGGAGGVGHIAIQLAKRVGLKVATTISSDEKSAFVRAIGADYVINYNDQNFVDMINQWTSGHGVDLVLDTVGAEIFEKSFAATAIYGDIITILQPPEDVSWKTARNRNLRISYELMLTPMLMKLPQALKHQVEILEKGAALFNNKRLKVQINETFPLEHAAKAHQFMEKGAMTGKLVLDTNA